MNNKKSRLENIRKKTYILRILIKMIKMTVESLFRSKSLINALNNEQYARLSIVSFIGFFLVISPLFPGVSWFQLGDFTTPVVNYYHVIMIPLALLLMIMAFSFLGINSFERKLVRLSVIPLLLLSFLGLILFYPSWAFNADAAVQTLRDMWMTLDALLLLIAMIRMLFSDRNRIKQIWGAYVLGLITVTSAGLTAIFGMILAYGMFYGYSAVPFFYNLVQSLGGTDVFIGNLTTSHSHQMLPAVMGGIVALIAIALGYEKLPPLKRNIVNAGMVLGVFGVISMSYLYWISAFGTYVIPAVFTSGAGGVNGLALDDTQSGLIGIGAMIALLGLIYAIPKNHGDSLLTKAIFGTGIGSMAALFGLGYLIEFNEVFYGFGSPPPTGGIGYQYDLAFMDGHLMYAFFFLPLMAGILLSLLFVRFHDKRMKTIISGLTMAGTIIGFEGLTAYLLTLNPAILIIAVVIFVVAILFAAYSLFLNERHSEQILEGSDR